MPKFTVNKNYQPLAFYYYMETYLDYFIKNKGVSFDKYFENNPIKGYFEKKRNGDNSSKSKVELAAEIGLFSLENKLTFNDFDLKDSELSNKIKRLFNTIEFWNN